jgi:hypothetical protein
LITYGPRLRTHTIGRRLIGLHVDDARELATRSHCHFRIITAQIRTTELDMRRINVRIVDDIVVDFLDRLGTTPATAGAPVVYPRGRSVFRRHKPPGPFHLEDASSEPGRTARMSLRDQTNGSGKRTSAWRTVWIVRAVGVSASLAASHGHESPPGAPELQEGR